MGVSVAESSLTCWVLFLSGCWLQWAALLGLGRTPPCAGPQNRCSSCQCPHPGRDSLALGHAGWAGPHQLVVLLGEQQDAANIGLVVVERVELRGGHVEGPSLREAIVQLLIEREQIHVMHGNVVRAVAALQEAHVDEGRPVEPVQGGQGGQGPSELAFPQTACLPQCPPQCPGWPLA